MYLHTYVCIFFIGVSFEYPKIVVIKKLYNIQFYISFHANKIKNLHSLCIFANRNLWCSIANIQQDYQTSREDDPFDSRKERGRLTS